MSDNKTYGGDIIIDVDEKSAIKRVNKFEKSFIRSMDRANKIAKGLENDKLTSPNNKTKLIENLDPAIFKKTGHMNGQTYFESFLDAIDTKKLADKSAEAFKGNKLLENMFSKKDLYISPVIELAKIKGSNLEGKENKLSKDTSSRRNFYVSPIIELAKTAGSSFEGKENKLSENSFDKRNFYINPALELSKATNSPLEKKKNKLSENTFNIKDFNIRPFVEFVDKIKSITGKIKEINTAYKDIKTGEVTDRSIFKNKKWFIKIKNSKTMGKVAEKVSAGYGKIKSSKAAGIVSAGYSKVKAKGTSIVGKIPELAGKIKNTKGGAIISAGYSKIKAKGTSIVGKVPELAGKIKGNKVVGKLSEGFTKFKGSKFFGKMAKGFKKIKGPLSLGISAANIATSKDKAKTSAEEAGGMAGAAIGGKVGAAIGSLIPVPVVGTAIGGAVGSIAGGFFGKKLAGKGIDLFRKRKEKDEVSKQKVKSYEAVDSTYTPVVSSGGLGTVNVNGVTLNMNTNDLDEETLIYKIGRAVYEAMENKAAYQIC